MNIGHMIRQHRKKCDLTQEKLADYLCVSYQAVSKWETGVSNPDLALIGPLTKLLHISADELFGLTAQTDARREELEQAHLQTWHNGDLDARLQVAEAAVSEYPGEPQYLNWLADVMYYRAMEYAQGAQQTVELEKVLEIYHRVLEDCAEGEVRNQALSGIVYALYMLFRRDEAKVYAEQYPKHNRVSRDDLLECCLTGEEKTAHLQQMTLDRAEDLLKCLYLRDDLDELSAAEQIVRILVPDGNYLSFHGWLFHIMIQQAVPLTWQGKPDEAIAALERAYEHVTMYDRMFFEKPGPYKFTAPLFDRIEQDTTEWCKGTPGWLRENFFECLRRPSFDPLREREDFRRLVALE